MPAPRGPRRCSRPPTPSAPSSAPFRPVRTTIALRLPDARRLNGTPSPELPWSSRCGVRAVLLVKLVAEQPGRIVARLRRKEGVDRWVGAAELLPRVEKLVGEVDRPVQP